MVLMVRLFWVFFFLGFGLAVSAQDDPVLMRINGKEVLRSEFERSYNKGGTSVGVGRKALDAYVNKFIDFRLKIEAAEVVGLDTSRVFQKEQDEYRRCLIKSYLTDEETAEQEARQYYDKMKSGRRAGRVYVKHILNISPRIFPVIPCVRWSPGWILSTGLLQRKGELCRLSMLASSNFPMRRKRFGWVGCRCRWSLRILYSG